MDQEQWEREYATQTAYLSAQLRALDKRPIQRRKAFIDHEIRCSGCGDPVVQIVALDPYRVIRYRALETHLNAFPVDMDPRERALAMPLRQRSIRLDRDWMFFPISDTEPDGERHLIQSACRCAQQHTFTLVGITRRVGKHSVARPTRREH